MKDLLYAARQIGDANPQAPGKSSLIRYFKFDNSAFGGAADYSNYGRNSGNPGGYNPSAPGIPAPGCLLDQHTPGSSYPFQTAHGWGTLLSWNGKQDVNGATWFDDFTSRAWSLVFAGLKPHDMSIDRSWHGIGSGADLGGTVTIKADGTLTVTSNVANPASSAAGMIVPYRPHLIILSYDNVAKTMTAYVGDWTGRWVTAINAAAGADITTSAPFPLLGRNRNGSPVAADGFLDDYAVYAGHALTAAEAAILFDQCGYANGNTYPRSKGHRNGPFNLPVPSAQQIDANSAAASAEFAGKANPAAINGAGGYNYYQFTTQVIVVDKAFRQNPANWQKLVAPIHYNDATQYMLYEDVPVPYQGRPSLGFQPSGGSDQHLAIYCPDTDEYWETGGSSGSNYSQTTTATVDGTTAVLTAVPASAWTGVAAVKNGRAVSGAGIPAGATILANNLAAGTVTLSAPTTVAGTGVTITLTGTDAAPAWTMTYGGKLTYFSLFMGSMGSYGATATGIPNLLGVPTVAELQAAIYDGVPIPHGLAAVMFDGLATQVWPAARHDGSKASGSAVIEGQWYRLKRDAATTAAIAAMPHPTGRAMAQAAQTYGMIIVDRNVYATLLQTEDHYQRATVDGLDPYGADPAGKPALGGINNGRQYSVDTMASFPWNNLELLNSNAINPGDGSQPIRPAPALSGQQTGGTVAMTWPDDPLATSWAIYAKSTQPYALSAALSTGAAITSLPMAALPEPVPVGSRITFSSGANTQTFVTSAVAQQGATALTVVSQTPNFAYPTSSTAVMRKRLAVTSWPQYTLWNTTSRMALSVTAINGGGESQPSADLVPPLPLRSRRRVRAALG